MMRGTNARRKASPWEIEPSCMSLIRLGTIISNAAAAGSKLRNGWMFAHWAGTPDTS